MTKSNRVKAQIWECQSKWNPNQKSQYAENASGQTFIRCWIPPVIYGFGSQGRWDKFTPCPAIPADATLTDKYTFVPAGSEA